MGESPNKCPFSREQMHKGCCINGTMAVCTVGIVINSWRLSEPQMWPYIALIKIDVHSSIVFGWPTLGQTQLICCFSDPTVYWSLKKGGEIPWKENNF